jgi:hypothetical protein
MTKHANPLRPIDLS